MFTQVGRLSSHIQRFILLLGCVVLFALWFTHVPLTEIDETRYSVATRTMVETGDYIIPHYNGHPRYQKPILYYWIQSIPVRLFGANEIAARLPSAIFATALVLILHAFLLYWLPSRVAGEPAKVRARGVAFLGAGALATMPLIAVWARAATTDITLTFFISCALLALIQADLLGLHDPHARKKWYLLAALATGLAFLTKGPMGLAIPGLAWLLYHAVQRDFTREIRRVPWGSALLVFLVVTVPWYAATVMVDGWGFLKHFFMNENLGRFTTTMEGHGMDNRLLGLVMYWPVALIALFPYSPFLMQEASSAFAGSTRLRADEILPRLRRFAWAWLVAVIGLFSISKTQLPSYIQSIAAAAAILFALHLLGLAQEPAAARSSHSRVSWGYVVAVSLLILLVVVFTGGPIYALLEGKVTGPFGGAPILPHPAQVVNITLALVGFSLITGILVSAIRRSPRLIAWVMAGWTVLLLVLLFAVAPLAVGSSYRYSVDVGNCLREQPADAPVFIYSKHPSEAAIYYAHRNVRLYGSKDQGSAFLRDLLKAAERNPRLLVVSDDMNVETTLALIGEPDRLRSFGPMTIWMLRGRSVVGTAVVEAIKR